MNATRIFWSDEPHNYRDQFKRDSRAGSEIDRKFRNVRKQVMAEWRKPIVTSNGMVLRPILPLDTVGES